MRYCRALFGIAAALSFSFFSVSLSACFAQEATRYGKSEASAVSASESPSFSSAEMPLGSEGIRGPGAKALPLPPVVARSSPPRIRPEGNIDAIVLCLVGAPSPFCDYPFFSKIYRKVTVVYMKPGDFDEKKIGDFFLSALLQAYPDPSEAALYSQVYFFAGHGGIGIDPADLPLRMQPFPGMILLPQPTSYLLYGDPPPTDLFAAGTVKIHSAVAFQKLEESLVLASAALSALLDQPVSLLNYAVAIDTCGAGGFSSIATAGSRVGASRNKGATLTFLQDAMESVVSEMLRAPTKLPGNTVSTGEFPDAARKAGVFNHGSIWGVGNGLFIEKPVVDEDAAR